ncbi:hypothetical protein BGW39_007255 [Mortierella sp. 14UC]|nr:hypothetical protein BGW39_007255 [Mortierella sp. 14UC]
MEKHKQQQLKAQAIQYRATAYRRDSHMGHYVSDILAVPAPAAIAEGPVKTSDSLEISMDDLTHKLQGVLSAQSDFRDDRRSSSESASRHSSHNRNQRKQQHHQQQFSEPAPMASATPIFPASSGISSRHTSITTSTSRPRTPEEALLQGLLDRIDQHTSERNQDRIRELELENEILRRHRQYRINPDLLVQHRDYGYALPQHHGNANLRHS